MRVAETGNEATSVAARATRPSRKTTTDSAQCVEVIGIVGDQDHRDAKATLHREEIRAQA